MKYCSNLFVLEDSHHCIEFLYDICLQKSLEFNLNKYSNFKKFNYEEINRQLTEADWNVIFYNISLENSQKVTLSELSKKKKGSQKMV